MTSLLEHLAWGSVRASVVLVLALLAMPLLRKSAASTRRALLALALSFAVVVPALAWLAPTWRVETSLTVPAVHGREALDHLVQGDVAPQPAAVQLSTARPMVPAERPHDPAAWLGVAWVLGALVVLARLVVGLSRASAIARRSIPAPVWSSARSHASRTLGVQAEVRESDEVEAPAVTGILCATVLVPPSSVTWSEETRRAVLLHELAHVRQKDCLLQVVAQLACALHCLNPLVWLVASRLRIEREFAADDAVVAAGMRPSRYAEDLLAIAGVSGREPAGTLGIGDGVRLAERVGAVLTADRLRAPLTRVRLLVVALVAAAVATIAACATPSEPTRTAAPVAAADVTTTVDAGSTIDPRLQQIAAEELERTMKEWQGASGSVLVLSPSTGEILASVGRAHGAPSDVAIRGAYVTGSTLKAITLSAALDDGAVTAADTFDCEHGSFTYQGKTMHDASPNGVLGLPEIMAVSSNVGITKVFDRMGPHRMEHWLRAFHLGVAPPVEGASAGSVPAQIEARSYAGAVTAVGESAMASPLQIAAVYATIANGGAYVAPTLTPRKSPAPREQIMKPDTARVVTAILEGAVNSERATGKHARIDGASVAGKTGTASWDLPGGGEGTYASFVGFVPASAPRYVIVVGVEQPKEEGSGGQVAAPAFARVASRALALH